MILANNSPLRRIPAHIDRKQILFFDGIRYSVEMADLAYNRLRETLYEIAQSPTAPESNSHDFASVILDAWSIIDLIHRLRGLLKQAPSIKQNSPYLVSFMKRTAEIENLRNSVQHLNQQIQKIAKLNLPVWGALSWATMFERELKSIWTCTMVAGTFFDRVDPLLSPLGKKFEFPVDLITLKASNCSVCLSDIIRNVEQLARGLERTLSERFKDVPYTGRDVLICGEIVFPKGESGIKGGA